MLLIVLSCKHTEIIEKSQGNEIRVAFEEQKKSTLAKRDIAYSPQWQNSIDFEGTTYVPLTTDKRISSFTSDNIKYSLDGNIWLKGKRNSNEWKFSIVTVLPNDVDNNKESGILLSEDWKTGKLSYKGYIGDKLFSPKNYVLKMKSRADINLKAAGSVQCKMLLREVCAGSGREEVCNRWFVRVCEDAEEDGNIETPNDEAGDGGGGSPGGGNSGDTNTPPIIKDTEKPKKLGKKDPCADKEVLNERKALSVIKATNELIRDLTLQNGFEHGSNAYINLSNGNITGFTEVRVGQKIGSGQEVPSLQAWHWLPNNQVEVTTDYNHTHPFESGPSSIDVFEGIFPYMATSNSSMDALSPAQKTVYLSYHSINVMTPDHDYTIIITDPTKWVNRYADQAADFDKFLKLSKEYKESGNNPHTAQELSLLDLYGDMIQIYRSDAGQANFEPLSAKVDPTTFRKIITKTNCN